MSDGSITALLSWRYVEDPCLCCYGSGVIGYSSGATWRGGMGATCITHDVCDTCWGTGDRFRTGVDLRRLRDEESARVAKAALTAVADSVGARYGSMGEVMMALDRLIDNRRSGLSVFAEASLCGLRNLIARAIGVAERKL